jgi:hypothetical protein
VILLGIGAALEQPTLVGLGAIGFASGHALLIASLGTAASHCFTQRGVAANAQRSTLNIQRSIS